MWTVQDRYGNSIYMTTERWNHILESRPELEPYLDNFLNMLQMGKREQDALAPNEYRYFMRCDELLPEHNHLVMIVIFKTELDDNGQYIPNNFVVTGWTNYIWSQ